jgi:hypothetical protein
MVESEVDQRIVEYQQAVHEEPNRVGLISFFGCLTYGTADSPRVDQIHKGMEYFLHKRQRQREVRARIAAVLKSAPTSPLSEQPIATKDMDVLIRANSSNAERVYQPGGG